MKIEKKVQQEYFEMERFHTKEEIEKHGFVVLAIRKKFKFE